MLEKKVLQATMWSNDDGRLDCLTEFCFMTIEAITKEQLEAITKEKDALEEKIKWKEMELKLSK